MKTFAPELFHCKAITLKLFPARGVGIFMSPVAKNQKLFCSNPKNQFVSLPRAEANVIGVCSLL